MVCGRGSADSTQDSSEAGEENRIKLEARWFSVDEVAERLGMSRYTISDWIKAGRLKGVKIGKYWRVSERDLEAFLQNPRPLQRRPAPRPTTED